MSETAVATIGELRRRIARLLADAFAAEARDGTPELDARLLVAHALGRDPSELLLADHEAVDGRVTAKVEAWAARRAAGEPVARITGHKEFWGLDLLLSADTLVPRPDTETVVEAALAAADRRGGRDAFPSILDLGTGTGAILLALLSERPQATGVGVDLAEGAVRTARQNAQRLNLAARARFIAGDWAEAIAGRFDLVVANPPYIETGTIGGLGLEVRDHDPHVALDGGADGLEAYRAIVGDLDRLVAPEGAAFLEIGAGQSDPVQAIGQTHGWCVAFVPDLSGIARVAVFERPQTAGTGP